MTSTWTGFEPMTEAECRRLLGTTGMGRLAVTLDALPHVIPVRCRFDGARLWCRTASPRRLEERVDGHVVGFEADDLDLEHGTGWCVSVTGTVHVAAPDVRDQRLPSSWAAQPELLALRADLIHGHRFAR